MGWTLPECVSCGENVDQYKCEKTQQMGYKCFSCGDSGHLPFSHPLIQNGAWLAVVQCPNCGTRDVWGGNLSRMTGIASGSIRYST